MSVTANCVARPCGCSQRPPRFAFCSAETRQILNRGDRREVLQRELRPAFGPTLLAALMSFLVTCTLVGDFACEAGAQVTFERLLNSAKEPQNWLTYSGDYAGRRFSPLDQINPGNARTLVAKWVYQTAGTGKFETTPLVVDGILYASAQN